MTCPPSREAHARLTRVIAAHGATHSDLVVRITATTIGDVNELHLRVSRSNGDFGVDRSYSLGPSDCESATELLALGVDRFLSSFPEWTGPPRPSRPAPDRWLELSLVSAVNSMWRPVGVDGQVGAVVDFGAQRHRLGGGVLVRASLPQPAGSGRFQQTSVLATARYRHRIGRWQLHTEARAGALLVSGLGFTENKSDLLPWWEGVVYGGRAVSWGSIGIELAVTGLQHKAVTSDGLSAENIPLLRLGLAVEVGLTSQQP